MLEVQAIDPYWREDKYALCFSVQESGSHQRKECLRTRIKNITIGNAGERGGADESSTEPNILQTIKDQSDGADASSTEPNILQTPYDQSERPREAQTAPISPSLSNNEIKTLIIATGICVCVVVLFAAILIFILARKKVQIKDERFPMRRVYLLAYDDHRAHTKAVQALATLLNKHCYCDVIYPKWFISDISKTGLYEWIVTQMDKSDFVVLVNSKAAYWTYTAQNKDTFFRAGENGPFSFSTSHLRSKEGKQDFLYTAIMTYFNYTDSNDVIPFNPGLQYKLPRIFLTL
ncbi:uncharacterized protein LOC124284356 [Haliotis rubra]|uniref:uncharacterized protein LOC124284356 n=1 Tax=Haliotis rubra TaxID=36100 RepID=UPI001EE61B3A|nr:uncharacterized protein LOC124284356 [Haliotis rubra]